jgi:hypothetical protein
VASYDNDVRSPAGLADMLNTDTSFFLQAICGDSLVTWQTFDDDPNRKDSSLARILHGTDQHVLDELDKLQVRGAGVYLMVNEGDGKGRSAKNVIKVRALFVDLDGAPLEPVKEFDPDLTIESSPGRYHAYWLLNDCPLEKFRGAQKALAAKFDSDPKVIDLCRVMRVPGYLHQKGEPFKTRILYAKL